MARCEWGADTRRYFVRQPGVEAPRGCALYAGTALGRDRRVHRMKRTLYVRIATRSRGIARRGVEVSPTPSFEEGIKPCLNECALHCQRVESSPESHFALRSANSSRRLLAHAP